MFVKVLHRGVGGGGRALLGFPLALGSLCDDDCPVVEAAVVERGHHFKFFLVFGGPFFTLGFLLELAPEGLFRLGSRSI